MKIFLDLDGVLADFVGGVAKWFYITQAELLQEWPANIYGIQEPLSRAIQRRREENKQHVQFNHSNPTQNLWNGYGSFPGIDCKAFWANLEPTQWMEKLVTLVKSYDPNFHIITTPGHSPEGYAGKAMWVKDRFGQDFDRIILTSHKELLAKPNTILIDDTYHVVTRFNEAGGKTVLVPAHYNILQPIYETGPAYVLEYLAQKLKSVVYGVNNESFI